MYEHVEEKALRGRIPMEGLIPKLRFFCVGGYCCTGGVFVVLEVLCCGALEVYLRFRFVLFYQRSEDVHSRFIEASF